MPGYIIKAYTRRKLKHDLSDITLFLTRLARNALLWVVGSILVGYIALGSTYTFNHAKAKEEFKVLKRGLKIVEWVRRYV